MSIYVQVLAFAILLALAWIFFRYIIRLVKSNESIADSLEDISQSMREISDKMNEKEETGNSGE